MKAKNIGEILKNNWQESGMSQKEFADAMNMSVRNLQYLFEKTDIHISQLTKASAVLKKDFIKEYLELLERDEGFSYPSEYNVDMLQMESVLEKYLPEKPLPKNMVNIQLNVKGEFTLINKYFPDFLSAIKREAELRGLSLA